MISEMITTAIETVNKAAAAATTRDSQSRHFRSVLILGIPRFGLEHQPAYRKKVPPPQ